MSYGELFIYGYAIPFLYCKIMAYLLFGGKVKLGYLFQMAMDNRKAPTEKSPIKRLVILIPGFGLFTSILITLLLILDFIITIAIMVMSNEDDDEY